MQQIISVSGKALQSLFAPGMWKIFILSVLLTIGALIAFVLLSTMAAKWWLLPADSSTHAAEVAGVAFASGIAAWFLFPGIMPIFVNFFDDRIATLIEKQDYPDTAPRPPEFWPELWHDVRFSALVIGLNIPLLSLYWIPGVNLFIFFPLNGYLLGREFFVMAARRHMPLAEANALRKEHGGTVMLAGMLLVLGAVMPFTNLIAPLWGVAVMTHLFHRITKPAEILPPYV